MQLDPYDHFTDVFESLENLLIVLDLYPNYVHAEDFCAELAFAHLGIKIKFNYE